MSTITFSRTSNWHSGWRGKQSVTDIRLEGELIGVIRGEENVGFGMSYYVIFTSDQYRGFMTMNLKEAKDRVRKMFT